MTGTRLFRFSFSALLMVSSLGGLAGSGQVVGPGGGIPTARELRNPPEIFGFVPASGPVGTAVIIQGINLSRTIRVTFDGVAAKFGGGTDEKLTARIPKGAKTGKIEVMTHSGATTSKDVFTVTE